MKTSKSAATKKAVVTKTTSTKTPANKAATKNVPKRNTAPEKKAFKKMETKKVVSKETPAIEALPLNVSHIISEADGKIMTSRFEGNMNNLEEVVFSPGMQFDISLFKKLVALKDAAFIRIYNAVNSKMEHTFVITAIGEKGNTIFLDNPNAAKTATAKTKKITGANKFAAAAPPPPPPPPTDGVGNMGSQCPAY